MAPIDIEGKTLIDRFLEDQKRVTPVERFSKSHESGLLPHSQRLYQDLIPMTTPGVGEQYRFEVDLDKCSGCKACVAACHNLNGLDDEEAWRDVGVLVDRKNFEFQQTITTACHHCAEPACMDGCPVLAYEKDKVTGIVKHLDDQCIGCQYCVLKCPYDVPKYSDRLGIVRKCDMCTSRLQVGEAPACAQACPNGAIKIRIGSIDEIKKQRFEAPVLPGTIDGNYTFPTTIFKTTRTLDDTEPADVHETKVQHTHWPLVWMLTLTQLGFGMLILALAARYSGHAPASLVKLELGGLLAGYVGMHLSLLHLGRPLYAWKAFLGFRKSWLSREIIGFGMFAAAGTAPLALRLLELSGIFPKLAEILRPIDSFLMPATVGALFIGVASSCMVYIDTRRELWKAGSTLTRFLGTAGMLGLITFALFGASNISGTITNGKLLLTAFIIGLFKIAFESGRLHGDSISSHLAKTVEMQRSSLRSWWTARKAVTIAGFLIALWSHSMPAPQNVPIGLLALGFLFAGEILERALFFKAVVPHKMPGMVS